MRILKVGEAASGCLRLFVVVAVLAAGPAFAQDHPLKGVALVIGESGYDMLPRLANPKGDARAIDELLGDLGFDVTRVLDGDHDKLVTEIADFETAAKGADVALLYYSGHGIEAGGENYLVPLDADLSIPAKAGETLIPVSAILDELARSVPVTILLLDACRTNGFPPGTMIQPPGAAAPIRAVEAGLAALRGPLPVGRADAAPDSLGMIIGFAASPGQAALDGAPGESNSPYAAALLKHLGASGYSFGDVMTMVSEEVYLKTRARQLPWVNSSLRRVLTFGAPPEDADPDEAAIRAGRRQLLLSIAAEPQATRTTVESIAGAEDVPLDALYGMLKVLGVDTTGGDLEKQLQEGARQLKAFKEQELGTAGSDDELNRLARLATRAQEEGAIALALKYREQATARARELSGARDRLEAGLKADRTEIARTFAEHAQTAALNFDYATAAEMFGEAYAEIARWDEDLALNYKRSEAEALGNQGYFRADNNSLKQAIVAYEEALRLVRQETQPAEWARVEGGLGVALFTLGERESGTGTLERAATTLAAAIAAAPADMPVVELGEVRMYLGNALATLGQRDTDTARLRASVALFKEVLAGLSRTAEPQLWANVQGNLALSLRWIAEREADVATARQSIAAFEAAIAALQPDKWPFDWAMVQNNYAAALTLLGQLTHDTTLLHKAAAALHAALEIQREDVYPLDWAMSEANLGNVYLALAMEGEGDTAALQASLEAFHASLRQLTREKVPFLWSTAQNDIGMALTELATKTGDRSLLPAAVDAFQQAIGVRTEATDPAGWAQYQANLASALQALGEAEVSPATERAAIAAAEAALRQLTKAEQPLAWAQAKLTLARALKSAGDKILGDVDKYKLAAAAFAEAQEVFTRAADPDNWAAAQFGRANALAATGEPDSIEAALAAYREEQSAIDRDKDAFTWGQIEAQVAIAYTALAEATKDMRAYQQALDAFAAARATLVPDHPQLDAQFATAIQAIKEEMAK